MVVQKTPHSSMPTPPNNNSNSNTQVRKSIEKYHGLESSFSASRQEQYERQHKHLTARLNQLIAGEDESYLQQVADLEEVRDANLVRLNLQRRIKLDRSRRVYEQDMASIDKSHNGTINNVNDKLIRGLESHIRRFKDDRTLWDISSENTADLGSGLGLPGLTTASGGPRQSSRIRGSGGGRRANGGVGAGGSNASGLNGTGGGSGGLTAGFGDLSGGSGSESGFRTTGGGQLRGDIDGYSNQNDHINSFLSEVDSETTQDNNAPTTRMRSAPARNARATKALTALKPDEVSEDMQSIFGVSGGNGLVSSSGLGGSAMPVSGSTGPTTRRRR